MNNSLFTVPQRCNSVERFAGKEIIAHRSNIASHSFEVAFYAANIINQLLKSNPDLLSPCEQHQLRADCMEYSLIHDIPEIITGDLPYTVKKQFPELKTLLDKVEAEITPTLIPGFNLEPSKTAKFVCKLGDALAVTREITSEVHYRNPAFNQPELDNCSNIFAKAFSDFASVDLYDEITSALYAMLDDHNADLMGILNYGVSPYAK